MLTNEIALTKGEARATEKPMALSKLFPYHQWDFGGFVDLGYSLDFNFPDNHRLTTTTEYRVPYRWTTSIFRLEYRYDNSTGPEGGFFKKEQNRLTPGQNILIFSVVWTLDSP